jgi:hypothetical protein
MRCWITQTWLILIQYHCCRPRPRSLSLRTGISESILTRPRVFTWVRRQKMGLCGESCGCVCNITSESEDSTQLMAWARCLSVPMVFHPVLGYLCASGHVLPISGEIRAIRALGIYCMAVLTRHPRSKCRETTILSLT